MLAAFGGDAWAGTVKGTTVNSPFALDVSNKTLGKRKRHKGELGVTGTPVFAGLIMAEPNADLRFPLNLTIYDKMRRSDGQVRASLLAISLPILSLDWEVEPWRPTDESSGEELEPTPEHIEIARQVRHDLFENLDQPWQQVLREVLGMLWAGFWIVEPVFEVGKHDGLVHLKKLATRLPMSVYRWLISRDGELRGIIQRAVNPESGAIEEVRIDRDDFIIFTHEREGADWTGMSVLRSAYKHWYMKDWLYRIGVINVERGGGFPVISLPDQADDDDIEMARRVGETIHLHERAYVIEPFGWKFRLEHATSRGMGDVVTQVEHHNHMISANILAQFMDFGVTPNGTRAAAGEFINLFLMAEDAVIRNIEDTINAHLIPRMVDYNWRVGPGEYPRLKAQNVRGFNVQRLGVVLRTLVDGQLIYGDDKLETFLRKAMGLPDADLESRRDRMGMMGGLNPLQAAMRPGGDDNLKGAAQGENADQQEDDAFQSLKSADPGRYEELMRIIRGDKEKERSAQSFAHELASRPRRRHSVDLEAPLWVRRELTSLERCVNLSEIDTKTKRAALEMSARIEPIQQQQIASLAKIARRELDGVTEVKVPYTGKVASSIRQVLRDVFMYGREQVRAELQRQATLRRAHGHDVRLDELDALDFKLAQPINTRRSAFDYFSAKADVLSERWANRFKDAAITAKLRAIRSGLDEEATEAEVRRALDELSKQSTRSLVLQTITEAFALGRKIEADEFADDIQRVQYSALLDENTCNICEDLDGTVGRLDDRRLQTPNPDCVGEKYGNTCRCILVYEIRG